MPLCSAGSSTYTDTELNTLYIPQSGGNPSIIATLEGNPRTRNDEGRLTSTSISEITSKMISLAFIPVPPTSTSLGRAVTDTEKTAFQNKDTIFKTNTQNEFCFYAQRYDYTRNKMIEILNSTTPQTSEFARYQNMAQILNRRLFDIANIIEYVKNKRNDSGDSINTLFADMKNYLTLYTSANNTSITTGDDISSNTILSGSEANVNTDVENIRRQMMGYTKEKVRATENLLSLYSFMNIFAIGMLVYVYRSMEE
jgi:hypothetical protein